jgi:hypothetical protein
MFIAGDQAVINFLLILSMLRAALFAMASKASPDKSKAIRSVAQLFYISVQHKPF